MLTWLFHYISAPRQSAPSGQLSFQLPLLKSCINIQDQLILSMGFKPHWHADESLIKWQAWEPSAMNEFTLTEMMGTPASRPRGGCSKNSLCSHQSLSGRPVSLVKNINYTQFSERSSLNITKHATSRNGKEILACALTKWNGQLSEIERLTWLKKVQTQMSIRQGRSCIWVS